MSPRLLEAVTWTLAHAVWQATVAAALLALVLAVVGPAQARLRHAAACVALLLQLGAPVVTLVGWLQAADGAAPVPVRGGASPQPLSLWVSSAWAAGVVVMALRLALGLLGVRRLTSRAEPLPEQWVHRLEALRERLRVTRPVRWLVSRAVDVPLTVGALRPAVVLPLTALTGIPPEQLELLVAHELLHVRRWDYAVNLLQSVVEVLLFFHPAAWWVSAQLRTEREACCDDGVVRAGVEPLAYVRALAALEEQRCSPGGPVLASNGGALMWRVQRLLSGGRARGAGRSAVGLGAAAAVLLGAGVVVAATPGTRVSSTWLPPAVERHRADIEAAAVRHGVDADLLAILVLVESGGDAQARSSRGARGLMQLMPGTAARVAAQRGLALREAALDEPALNLDLGASYLAQQLERFSASGDPVALAAAAYNGGPEQVQAWLEGRGVLSGETQRYQERVVSLWRERTAARSGTYDGWRERLRQRLASLASPPVGEARVSRPYGPQPDPFTGSPSVHRGVDLAAAPGTPVVSPLDGVVREVSADAERGNVVVLQHADGVQTRYDHLGSIQVRPGQRLVRGEPFATLGATGKVTGPHVHFEVLDLGEPVDPAPFLR